MCALNLKIQQGRMYITNYYNVYFYSKIPLYPEVKVISLHFEIVFTQTRNPFLSKMSLELKKTNQIRSKYHLPTKRCEPTSFHYLRF